jgi:hypothetical protein
MRELWRRIVGGGPRVPRRGDQGEGWEYDRRGEGLAMYKLTLRIDGDITMETFRDAVARFVHLLREVEDTVADGREVRWTLADLRHGSPALLTWLGTPRQRKNRKKERSVRDLAPAVATALLAGVEKLERGQGRPEAFSDDALDAALQLARVKSRRGITGLAIIGENSDQTKGPRVLEVTERVVASINEIVGPRYTAPGSVDGLLQAINSRGRLYFTIYDAVWAARARCDIPDRLKAEALEAFDQRVLVTGLVSRDAHGHPRHIKVETLERVDVGQLPHSIRGIDPDFTGGMESSEYLNEPGQAMPEASEKRYWDSSVFLALIKDEQGRADTCEHIINDARAGRVAIYTSMITLTEVVKRRRGPVEADRGIEDVIAAFFLSSCMTSSSWSPSTTTSERVRGG